MLTSPTVRAARSYQPLIRFIGKRQWPTSPEASHPHPAAPSEFRERFADFLKHQSLLPNGTTPAAAANSAAQDNGGANTYTQFWEAPSKYWQPRIRSLEDWEVDAIMTGGATSYQRK